MLKYKINLLFFLCLYILTFNSSSNPNKIQLEKIMLPDNFKIELFADKIEMARSMALSPDGIIFIGSKNGNVYALTDRDKNGKIEKKYIIAKKLDMPVGVDYKDGSLYISSINKIIRLDQIESKLENPPEPVIVNDSFPSNKWHGWKFIKIGPDNKIYVPVGAPCNICDSQDTRYSTIMRMNLDGKGLEIFASGIRNTVGFDWHPDTKELWFTENGRDMMGDDIPPDELNCAPKKGMHFGFPYFHGKNIMDPKYGLSKNINNYIQPAIELGPHVASLGMRFYTGKMFPENYKNQIFIAEHGSWNRSTPIGYRITLVKLIDNKAVSYSIFAEGWLQDNEVWGRPVDIEVYYDGSLLVSDDKANVIYRIYYKE